MRRQGASAPSVLHGFVLPARLLFLVSDAQAFSLLPHVSSLFPFIHFPSSPFTV